MSKRLVYNRPYYRYLYATDVGKRMTGLVLTEPSAFLTID